MYFEMYKYLKPGQIGKFKLDQFEINEKNRPLRYYLEEFKS